MQTALQSLKVMQSATEEICIDEAAEGYLKNFPVQWSPSKLRQFLARHTARDRGMSAS